MSSDSAASLNRRIMKVLSAFPLEGTVTNAVPCGNGHINNTYCVTVRIIGGAVKRYVVQQINTAVFHDPDGLMSNIIGVTSFLRQSIEKSGGDPERETLNVIHTPDGKPYMIDDEGGCWRVYLYIEDTFTYDSACDPAAFGKAASAFGRFMKLLADYPAGTLKETIPHFHDTGKRFERFREAVAGDVMGRAAGAAEEIEFICSRKSEMGILTGMLAAGELPLRVTHNDTKLNNVLFDKGTGDCLCVIDLDTVMPGLCLYDYGDSIRFGASTAAEDEADLSLVSMDLTLFEAFTQGYLMETGSAMTDAEISMLPMGAKLMTLECGMRFLTDYLMGDVYFQIHRDSHNLDRARTQLKLVADMESKWEEMHEIVKRCRVMA